MAKTKVRFTFATEGASHDPKTTVIMVKRMQVDDEDETYAFPPHLQSISLYDVLMATPSAKTTKKALNVRHEVLKLIILLDTELTKKYIDEDGNAVFEGEMLEESSCFNTQFRTVGTKLETPELQMSSR